MKTLIILITFTTLIGCADFGRAMGKSLTNLGKTFQPDEEVINCERSLSGVRCTKRKSSASQ